MSARSRTSIPTGVYGKAYLVKAWEARDELVDYERRGFAQFFYLTICGHIEAVLVDVICTRLKFVEIAIRWETLPPMQFTDHGNIQLCPVTPIADSIRSIVAVTKAQAGTAPLGKLTELYGRVFGRPLSALLGPELDQEIKALASLRNVFAHGRDLVMEFDGEPNTQYQGTLDGNVLKHAAQRLLQAGVLSDLNITGLNYDDFFARFFGDAAMLHFHRAVRSAEDVIRGAGGFAPEKTCLHLQPLPDLNA
jgi:hypothetical protein